MTGLKEDAFGEEVYAYFKKRKVIEIVERDDRYIRASLSAIKRYFAKFKDWEFIEKKAIAHVKGKILDIGCGVGRVELYLQSKGYNIIGIDNSKLAVKVSKLRGVKNAKLMGISEVNKFKPNSFDTIIMFGNNFGLFRNYVNAKILLKKFYRITSKDAVIIAVTRDPYKTNNKEEILYYRRNIQKGRMGGQDRIRIRFENKISDWFDYLFVSKKEMRMILSGTGWKIQKFISDNKFNYATIIGKSSQS